MGCSIGKPRKSSCVKEKRTSVKELSITPGTFVKRSKLSNYDDYIEVRKLGSGAFADVMLCHHKPTKVQRAVKVIHKAGISIQQRDPIYLLKEIQILRTIDHPNVLKCYEIFEDSLKYYVATEYCAAGDLFSEILKLKRFTEASAARIMHQLLSALIYCHEKSIIHRDLKPENILIVDNQENISIKVADFGSSCIIDPDYKLSGCYGSAYYLAPEVLKNSYDKQCDI